jgi:hypothetical protein
MRVLSTFSMLVLAALVAGSFGGCKATTTAAGGDAAPVTEEGPVANVKFLAGLADKPNATMSDVYRCGYILLKRAANDEEGSKAKLPAAGYRQSLVDAGVIGTSWDEGSALAEHGQAAYVFSRAIGLGSGVLGSLTGSARYAHREMIDRGLMPRENIRQYIGGPALVASFRDSRVWQDKRK